MKKNNDLTQRIQWARKYWFQIGLVVLFIVLISNKKISLHFGLKNPDTFSKDEMPEVARAEFNVLNLFSFKNKNAYDWKTVHESTIKSYYTRYAKVAQEEGKKYQIPASFILAVAMMESQMGKTDLTERGNNHFGLLCDDNAALGAKKMDIDEVCYRFYDSAWFSFRDFSQFVLENKNLAALSKDKNEQSYKMWCKKYVAEKSPKTYNAKQLIELIETLGLNNLDK